MRILTAEVDLEHFALITHAVPAQRVRPHIPERFDLDTIDDDHGRPLALVTVSFFRNRNFHWSPLPRPTHDFDQTTFRTYVRYRGRPGAWFFGTFVGTTLSLLGQGAVASGTSRADFEVDVDATDDGYARYAARATAGERGIAFDLDALERPAARPPFATGDELAQFITYRLDGFNRHQSGVVLRGPVAHRAMRPWSGRLRSGRFDVWERLGILEEHEWMDPYSVLVEPLGDVRPDALREDRVRYQREMFEVDLGRQDAHRRHCPLDARRCRRPGFQL